LERFTAKLKMEKIQGTWNGEYSINYGTEDEPDIQYFSFELRIKGDEDGFNGEFIDQTLRTQNSEVKGFVESDFISFVRTANSQQELHEFLAFEPSELSYEFNFSGNYNEQEKAFEGIWEAVVEEVNEGLQESVLEELRTGAWYFRKI
jgi:hypothetical protein